MNNSLDQCPGANSQARPSSKQSTSTSNSKSKSKTRKKNPKPKSIAMNYHRLQFSADRDRLLTREANQNTNRANLVCSEVKKPTEGRQAVSYVSLPPIHPLAARFSKANPPLPPIGYNRRIAEEARRRRDLMLEQAVRQLGASFAMGQTLSEPVTTKSTSKHENSFVKIGSSCMQGWRISMEDAHSHLLSLPGDREACFFGVYDGHGGVKVAQYAGNTLHRKIVSQPAYSKRNIPDAIKQGFLALDEDMLKDETMKDEMAGSTAVVVLIKDGKMYCGNVGDSRAVASVCGEVERLSFDHKPGNDAETRRIVAAGGWVEFNRVNGNLALSRALGDFMFKKNEKKKAEEQIVTAHPDVIEKPVTPDHEFIILACDGIWDVMTNQEAVDFVRCRIAQRLEPDIICEELMMRCLAPDCQTGGLGCDNMTVILVCFLQGGSYDELARKCARPSRHTSGYHGLFDFK